METWIDIYQLDDNDYSYNYAFSLYFSMITMCTVGYGDIAPYNIIEKMVVSLFCLLCSVLFAFNVNSIGTIINELSRSDNEFDI